MLPVPVESTTAIKDSPAGTYPITITQGTLAAANYKFTFASGTLTVTNTSTPVALTVSPNPITPTTVVTYSVTIGTPAAGQPNPVGTITLYGILPSRQTIKVDGPDAVGTPGTDGVTTFSKTLVSGIPPEKYYLYATFQPASGSAYQPGTSSQVVVISQ